MIQVDPAVAGWIRDLARAVRHEQVRLRRLQTIVFIQGVILLLLVVFR